MVADIEHPLSSKYLDTVLTIALRKSVNADDTLGIKVLCRLLLLFAGERYINNVLKEKFSMSL